MLIFLHLLYIWAMILLSIPLMALWPIIKKIFGRLFKKPKSPPEPPYKGNGRKH